MSKDTETNKTLEISPELSILIEQDFAFIGDNLAGFYLASEDHTEQDLDSLSATFSNICIDYRLANLEEDVNGPASYAKIHDQIIGEINIIKELGARLYPDQKLPQKVINAHLLSCFQDILKKRCPLDAWELLEKAQEYAGSPANAAHDIDLDTKVTGYSLLLSEIILLKRQNATAFTQMQPTIKYLAGRIAEINENNDFVATLHTNMSHLTFAHNPKQQQELARAFWSSRLNVHEPNASLSATIPTPDLKRAINPLPPAQH